MRLFIFFLTLFLILLAFKLYVLRGIYQASHNTRVVWIYGIISFATLILGFLAMRWIFGNRAINMSWWPNFLSALMLSVIICELLMSTFFIVDDIALLVQKLSPSKHPNELATPGNRRRFLKTIGLALSSIPFSAYLYGITKGKYDYKVFRKALHFADLPEAFDGISIAQFSDFHSGSFDDPSAVEKGLQLLQAQNADLILFTGDLVNDLADEVLPYKTFLKALKAPLGKFAVLGNHDYPEDGDERNSIQGAKSSKVASIIKHHEEAGFKVLTNENTKIEKSGSYLRLLGVENWGTRFVKHGDLQKSLEGTNPGEFSILLSHDPTHWEYEVLKHPQKIHLTLSGHTHGLQMGVDLPRFKWSPIKYVYKRWLGLYKEEGQYLYVNRGFGFIGFAGRVGIRPEITIFTLKKAKS